MCINRVLISWLFFSVATLSVFSQTVSRSSFNSGGTVHSNVANYSLSFSIGQLENNTYRSANHIFTEGYQQPVEKSSITIISDNEACLGDEIILTAVSRDNEYMWFFENPNSSIVATGNQVNFVVDNEITVFVQNSSGRIDSTIVTLKPQETCPVELVVYELITPNGDNDNDTWVIDNIELLTEYKISLYNKWNQLIYEGTDYQNDWDGNNHTDGTYLYIVEDKDRKRTYQGILVVQR